MPTPAEWIKDGTPSEVPVTTETPAVETASVEASPVVDTTATVDTPATVAAEATAAATAAGASPDAAAAAGAQAAQDFIEGRLGDQPFQIPKGVQLPWKRGNETGFAPIEELQLGGMRERDYRIKTSELAAQRRELEVQARVQAARAAAIEEAHRENEERVRQAYASPEEQAKHEAFLTQYRHDPYFKQQVDAALEGRVLRAEQAARAEYESEVQTADIARQVASAIEDIGQKYPDVDPSFIRQQYSEALVNDRLPLSAAAIESLYQAEAQRVARYREPLTGQLDALRAEIAQLKSRDAAEAHNTTTRQALRRAANPVAAPVGGTPPAPVAPATNLSGRTMQERSREWSRL